jgi:hypothetical protein
MMATFSKLAFSGSTNGKPILVTETETPGDTIHTAVAGGIDFDEVWLYACNHHTGNVSLTIEFGGTASPDDLVEVGLPNGEGLVLAVPGLVLQNELVVKAFASIANVITIHGWVNRIDQ